MRLEDYIFFNSLEPFCKAKIKTDMKPISLPAGTFLYYQGDINDSVLFLSSGSVKVFLNSAQIGKGEITLYYISPGEQCLVNMLSAVTQSPTMATAIATENIEGWLLPYSSISWLIDNSKTYREFKVDFCSKRLSQILQLVEEIKFKRIDERLLNWLFVQGRDTINTTHEQIAQILGTSREVISRILKNFEREGIVILGRGYIKMIMQY